MRDRVKVHGICRVREYPQEWSMEDFRYWWTDERDRQGHLLHKARMSAREKDRYTVAESANILVNQGFQRMLTNASDTAANLATFTDVLDVNNGAISGVLRTDTSMPAGGTSVRKTVNGYTITGTQSDISFVYGSTDAVFTITNVAIWGHGATTTPNTGFMHTHALFNYNHPAISVTFDYLIIYTN